MLVGLRHHRIAVTARIDIADGPVALEQATALTAARADAVLIAIYIDADLPSWLAAPPACLDAVLVCARRWRSLLCTRPGCCPPQGRPVPESTPPVVSALIAQGRVALASREEVAASLRPGAATIEATTRAEALLGIAARDVAWLGIEAHVRAGGDLHPIAAAYLDLARHCVQDHRTAPAWFLYAWTMWRLGDGVHARIALDRLFGLDPAYSGARLLERALDRGRDGVCTPVLFDAAARS